MAAHRYRTTPDQSRTNMPPGVPFIIGNELAERFSFYGMKGILTVFMTTYMLNELGEADNMGEEQAKGVYHAFTAAAYFFPILGAIVSDVFLGKYRTILWISLMYCVGHGCLAMMDAAPEMGMSMRPWLLAGLVFIAIGAGAIKPCVSANVGDQFGAGNKRLLTQVFNWFYFSINLGAMTSMFLTPMLLREVGPWLAFGLPGALMAVATFVFWLGRNKFVHVPPAGWRSFSQETFGPQGRRAILNLSPLFLIFVPVFWAIFDQTGSAWVLQAEKMDPAFAGHNWLPAQIQSINPLMILAGIPLFTYVVYPAMGLFFKPTPLRKVGIGFVLTAASFALSAWIESGIAAQADQVATGLWAALNEAGIAGSGTLQEAIVAAKGADWSPTQLKPYLDTMPNVGWQFLAYAILTSGEILVSIVCLEFAYTQSPPRMKSFVMGIYFLGVSLGNLFTSGVNFILGAMKGEDGTTALDGANYYWFFAGLMAATTVVFVVFAQFYRGETYIQGEDKDVAGAEAEAEGPDAR